MYCQSCGTPLAMQMKYCNRCGAHLVTTKEDDTVNLFEKRMDSEMEGLFWITVLGLALILGGMALLKKVQLSESLIIAYMILSSMAFIAYFGLGVWQVRRLNRSSKEASESVPLEGQDTNELGPAKAWPTLEGGVERHGANHTRIGASTQGHDDTMIRKLNNVAASPRLPFSVSPYWGTRPHR